MNNISDEHLDAYRALAQQLAQRVQNDPLFRMAVENDPVSALSTEGLPEDLIPIFLRETEVAWDVAGYMDELEHRCFVTG